MNLTHILPISVALSFSIWSLPEASAAQPSLIPAGCYVQAEVQSQLNEETGELYAEGTSNCLSDSGEVISEDTVGLILSGTPALADAREGGKIFATFTKDGAVQVYGSNMGPINDAKVTILSAGEDSNAGVLQPVVYRGGGAVRGGAYRGGAVRGGAVGVRGGGVVVRGGAAAVGVRGIYTGTGYCDPNYYDCGGYYGGGGGVVVGGVRGAAVVGGVRGGAVYRGGAVRGGAVRRR